MHLIYSALHHPGSHGTYLAPSAVMNFEFKILIVGSNASLVNYMAAKVRKIVDNDILKSSSIPETLTLAESPYLIFLSAELVARNPMMPDLTGMRALQQRFPSAGIVVFGEDDLQNNLNYVTNGARDYVTRTMLVMPQIDNFLKKRMANDWAVRPIYAN